MRHPSFMAAFADRMGDIDNLSGFIVIFLVVTVVTALWNDVSKYPHGKVMPASEQSTEMSSKQELMRQIRDEPHDRI